MSESDQGLYILSIPGNYWKIGRAFDVEPRIKLLQCGCPEKISLYAFLDVAYHDISASEIEHQLHKRLCLYRTSGEWFHAPRRTIDAAFKEVWAMLLRPDVYARWERFCAHCRVRNMSRAISV